MANAELCISNPSSPSYDKLHKIRRMLDEVCDRFKTMWSPCQQMTIDKGIVIYKGKYCLMRQCMPKKPVRSNIKVWTIVDAISKYLWNFQVYFGKQGNCNDDEDMLSNEEGEDGNLEANEV